MLEAEEANAVDEEMQAERAKAAEEASTVLADSEVARVEAEVVAPRCAGVKMLRLSPQALAQMLAFRSQQDLNLARKIWLGHCRGVLAAQLINPLARNLLPKRMKA